MEYAIYPFRFMNITQRHDKGNHLPHWKNSKNYSDKPWDEACQDTGRSYFEPRNDFKIEQILGNANNGFSVRLRSIKKLQMPSGRNDYLLLTLTHMNADDMSKVKVGQVLKAGSKVLREGTSGYATGNHFHITANVGKYYGLLQNSNGKWCFTYEKSLEPQEAFYLDKSYTTVKSANGYKFTDLPKPKTDYMAKTVARDVYKDQIEVKVLQLIVRDKPTLKGTRLGYANKGIYNLTEKVSAEGYTWYKLNSGIYAPSKDNWVVEHKAKVKEEPVIDEPIIESPNDPIIEEPIEKEEPIIEEKQEENIIVKIFKLIVKFIQDIFKKEK